MQRLTGGPDLLAAAPVWAKLTEFEYREVRYILVGDHEMRYEITATGEIWILRLWQTANLSLIHI